MLGMIAGARFGDYEAGLRFSKLGKELVEHRGLKRFQARTYLNFANVVMPWTQRFRSGRDLLRRAFETASNSGDVTFAAYSCASLNVNLLAAGDPLAEAQCEAENRLRFAENARFGFVSTSSSRSCADPDAAWLDKEVRRIRRRAVRGAWLRAPPLGQPGARGAGELVLDQEAAGALLRRRICVRPGCGREGPTLAMDAAAPVRGGRV